MNLFMSLKKCIFFAKKSKILVVTKEEISTKLKIFRNIILKNIYRFKNFLELCTYNKKFVKNF